MLLCNFNVNNLFVRYRFGKTFPGDRGSQSRVTSTTYGYLPLYQPGAFEVFNPAQRELAALAITQGGTVLPDVICIQEVESLIALREFNEKFLGGRYRYAVVLDSRDLRQIDVGILSMLPIDSVATHVDDVKAGEYIFSRDCLEARVRLKSGRFVTFFINHFKSKLAIGADEEARAAAKRRGDAKRQLQARSTLDIVRGRFPGDAFGKEYFAVLGDLNDTPPAPQLKSLLHGSGLVDAIATLPPEARWTHYWKAKSSVSQLDHLLLSPALASSLHKKAGVWMERRGIGYRSLSKKPEGGLLPKTVRLETIEDDPAPLALDFQFDRFDSVSDKSVASDHCAVFARFKI